MKAYRLAIVAFAATFVCLGLAITAVTALRGGGVGLLLGPLFVALGVGRLYLLRSGTRTTGSGRDSSSSDGA